MVGFGEASPPRIFLFRPGRRLRRRPGRRERLFGGTKSLQTPLILNIGIMKYHIVTLGCPKNIVDSEGMGGILAAQGHTSVTQPGDADVVIVNTCSFIAA